MVAAVAVVEVVVVMVMVSDYRSGGGSRIDSTM